MYIIFQAKASPQRSPFPKMVDERVQGGGDVVSRLGLGLRAWPVEPQVRRDAARRGSRGRQYVDDGRVSWFIYTGEENSK